jgi:hypothetical protein
MSAEVPGHQGRRRPTALTCWPADSDTPASEIAEYLHRDYSVRRIAYITGMPPSTVHARIRALRGTHHGERLPDITPAPYYLLGGAL